MSIDSKIQLFLCRRKLSLKTITVVKILAAEKVASLKIDVGHWDTRNSMSFRIVLTLEVKPAIFLKDHR